MNPSCTLRRLSSIFGVTDNLEIDIHSVDHITQNLISMSLHPVPVESPPNSAYEMAFRASKMCPTYFKTLVEDLINSLPIA